MLLSGKEFNKGYNDIQFIKLTNMQENHNDYQFKTGINTDIIKFNPTEECKAGGIYFCKQNDFFKWLSYGSYGSKIMYWYREVIIPDHAQVYVEAEKCKADVIILGDRKEISELWNSCSPDTQLNAIENDPYSIEHISNPTDELCLACLLYTSPSPRDGLLSRMPSSA